MTILALDLGSTAVKAGLVDARGRVLDKASTPTPNPRGSIREVDPEAWWAAAARVIQTVAARAGPIDAVVPCGFMHTLVAVDDAGRALGPAVLMGDIRTAPADGSAADSARRMTGWLERAPEAAKRVAAFLTAKDFLRLRLTGELATDRYDSDGAGMPLLPPKRPHVLEPWETAGRVTERAGRVLGLASGTPVLAGSGDWMANLIGTSAAFPDRLCLYLGTSAALGAFPSYEHLTALHDPRCVATAADSGTAVNHALRMVFPGHEDPFAAASSAVEQSPIGAGGVTFLPYLGGARPGQRNRTGSLHGLSLNTSQADLARAVLEGLVFWIRTLAEPHLASKPELVLCGGGARSPALAAMFADVLETTVVAPEETDAGLVGLARLADSGIPPVGDGPVRAVGPDPGRVPSYRAAYRLFAEYDRVYQRR